MGAVGGNLGGLCLLNQSRIPASSPKAASHPSPIRLNHTMRHPSATELEAGILLFAWAVTFCWLVMRLFFYLVSA